MAFWITKCFKLSQIRYCVKKKKGLDRNQKNYNVRALVQNSNFWQVIYTEFIRFDTIAEEGYSNPHRAA